MRRAAQAFSALRAKTRDGVGGLRFRGLGRDYWAADMWAPRLRAALGVVSAPALTAAAFAALGALAEALLGEPPRQVAAYAGAIFFSMLEGLYDLAYAPTLLAFLTLWSLRLRSLAAYLVAGLVSGAATAAATAGALGYWSLDVTVTVLLLNLTLLIGARALASIRDRSV